jgi:pimeloyl-ACP methyl ester carboxylesterase
LTLVQTTVASVVLVHGIAQEQCSADSLEKDWISALAGGIRKAGFAEIADRLWRDRVGPASVETRMAFYGHLFLRPDQQGGGDPGDLMAEEQACVEQLAEQWLGRAATRASKAKERQVAGTELAYVRHETGTEEAGRGETMRKALRSLAKLRWFAPYGMAFAERFVIKALAQVTRYLADESIRRGALKAVLDLTGPDTQVIIGHSLGSVVAYEAAHLLDRPLPLLVTLGSPLGLDTIVYPKLRPQPPSYPAQALRWVNLADRDDFVAAEPDLSGFFSRGLPPGARFEGAHTVDNGAQPHSAEFYLTKAQLGRPVGETLSR